jgi:hypothetical protein
MEAWEWPMNYIHDARIKWLQRDTDFPSLALGLHHLSCLRTVARPDGFAVHAENFLFSLEGHVLML